jgi:hypothetical protein
VLTRHSRQLALALVPSITQVVALDIEPYLETFNRPYWTRAGVSSKIDFRIAPALESLAKLKEEGHEGFDLVFIDADKPSYRAYVEQVLELGLLKENGVILAVSPAATSALVPALNRFRSQDNTLYKVAPLSCDQAAFVFSLALVSHHRDTPGRRLVRATSPPTPSRTAQTIKARARRPRAATSACGSLLAMAIHVASARRARLSMFQLRRRPS